MKKTDLYRSIDGIRQDDCLKEQILKAAEENDVVKVIRRPVFVPVMIALLLCLNVGMAVKLVIFNKSQVNMSEFKARTSMSSAADIDDDMLEKAQEQEELERAQEQEELDKQMQEELDEQEEMMQDLRQNEFEAAKAEFMTFKNLKPYISMEMSIRNSEITEQLPAYLLTDMSYQEYGNCNYCRFVEVVDYPESDNGPYHTSTYALTNNEYIIGYEGTEFTDYNIVSITKSVNKSGNATERMILNAFEQVNSSGSQEKIHELSQEYIEKNDLSNETEGVFNISECLCLFDNAENDTDIVFRIMGSVPCDDGTYESIEFFVDENGDDVTDYVNDSAQNYWNDTIYLPEGTANSNLAAMPDVSGMSVDEAIKTLEDAGLEISSRRYEPPSDINDELGTIMSTYPSAGTHIRNGEYIELIICARMMPELYGYKVDDATAILEKMGVKVKLEYEEGVDSDSEGLYVEKYSPSTIWSNEILLEEGEEVTLYLASSDTYTACELIGCAVNLYENSPDYRKIYSPEETQEVISGSVNIEDYSTGLDVYGYYQYRDMTFYGKQYGKMFLIESVYSNSQLTSAVPGLICGLAESEISKCLENEYYKNKDAMISMPVDEMALTYDYLLSYTEKDGSEVAAYIDVKNGYVSSIYVTANRYLYYDF